MRFVGAVVTATMLVLVGIAVSAATPLSAELALYAYDGVSFDYDGSVDTELPVAERAAELVNAGSWLALVSRRQADNSQILLPQEAYQAHLMKLLRSRMNCGHFRIRRPRRQSQLTVRRVRCTEVGAVS